MKPYYEDDLVTLYHHDCLDMDEWRLADIVVTDPPYGIGWKKGLNRAAGSRRHDGIVNDQDTSCRDEMLRLANGMPCAVFGSFYAPYPPDVRQVLVWWKPADAGVVGSTTGYRRDVEPIFLVGPWPQRNVEWPAVLRSARGSIAAVASETGHPHTKPTDLMARLIERCPAGVIADPFAGSGSTLIAAKHLGRRAIGVEVDEAYCEVIAGRLSQGVLDLGGVA